MTKSELIEKYAGDLSNFCGDMIDHSTIKNIRDILTRFRAELRAEWERELGEPVAWAWEWTENEGLTTKREIYTDREVVAVRAHMFGGVCVPLIARIESDRAKIEQLESEIDKIAHTVYCPTCGSCGESGCCHPDKCKTVQCYYGADNMKSYKELLDENEQLEETVEELRGLCERASATLSHCEIQLYPQDAHEYGPSQLVQDLDRASKEQL